SRAALLARLSVALAFAESPEQRRGLAERAVAMARRIGDQRVLASALAALCDAIAGPDDVRARLAIASEIVELARAGGDRMLELLGRRLRLIALAELGDWPDVDQEINAYALVCDLVRRPAFAFYVPLWRGMRALMHADFDASAGHAREAARLAEAAG